MLGEFSFSSELRGSTLLLRTSGYINNTGGESIYKEVERQMPDGVRNVVLNMQESRVINSIGISFLIDLIKRLKTNDGQLVFTGLDPTVEKAFMIMGLFTFAQKADGEDEAIQKLGFDGEAHP